MLTPLTLYGLGALSFMLLMYALERRHRLFVLAFAAGCALSAAYGFLAGTWPFGAVELVWCGIALWRYRSLGSVSGRPPSSPRAAPAPRLRGAIAIRARRARRSRSADPCGPR